MKTIAALSAILLSASSSAEIKVAFFSALTPDGEIIQFEPGGRFSHIAVAYRGGWIHADPKKGVEVVGSLERIGRVSEILVNSAATDLTVAQIEPYLGLPYDRTFAWRTRDATYCAKFIGNLLGIDPQPMAFSAPGWRGIRGLSHEGIGLSADDVYRSLLSRNYRKGSVNCDPEVLKMGAAR